MSRRYPKRLTLELTTEQYDTLKQAKLVDNLPINARLRGLIDYWISHPEIHDDVRTRTMRIITEESSDVT